MLTNALQRSAYDSEGLAYWLSFTANAFVLLKKEIPADSQPDDFDSLSRPTLADNLDDFKPVTKFFHELTVVSFDIFSVLLINIYSVSEIPMKSHQNSNWIIFLFLMFWKATSMMSLICN